MKKAFVFIGIFVAFAVSAQDVRDTAKTSIAMLNYLATESSLIEKSRTNRMVLEEIRRKLENTTNPSVVDIQTQGYLNKLLQSLTGMGLTTLQREKIQMMYENEKSQALTQALPNPLYLLSMRNTNPLQLIASAALMSVDSFIRYKSAEGSADFNYLLGDLELQAEDLKNLANLTGDYFNYMINISRKYNLNVSDSLNNESIGNFVKYILDDNLQRRRQWLEENQSLYANYGLYWLGLTDTYYELKMYEQCLKSIQQYENIQAPIFRKDYDFAAVLPKVILAAGAAYGNNATYQRLAGQYLQKISDNTSESDWSIRYFAAQVYISLAGLGNKESNLTKAYNLLVSNITYLSREQDNLVKQYLSPIVIRDAVTGDQKKQAEKIAKEMERQRKTELPPLHPGLALNYQVLFPLMDELNKTQAQRIQVSGILSKTFVMPEFRHKYFGDAYNYTFTAGRKSTGKDVAGWALTPPGLLVIKGVTTLLAGSQKWEKISLKLPAAFLTSDSEINVNLIGPNSSYLRTEVKYSVDAVVRTKTNDINEFVAEISVPLDTVLLINKDEDYKMVFTIKTHDMSCEVSFSCPKGILDFSLENIE